jgi:ketosteroid isomerase-like protein
MDGMTDPAADPATMFRRAIERGDVDAAVALFAPDVVFHSPVVHKPYRGREALRAILTAVVQVFEDFRYTGSYAGETGHVLEFATRVGDRDLQGVDILRGTGGTLTELTVLVRPYSAATLLRERMAALLT